MFFSARTLALQQQKRSLRRCSISNLATACTVSKSTNFTIVWNRVQHSPFQTATLPIVWAQRQCLMQKTIHNGNPHCTETATASLHEACPTWQQHAQQSRTSQCYSYLTSKSQTQFFERKNLSRLRSASMSQILIVFEISFSARAHWNNKNKPPWSMFNLATTCATN